MYKFKNGNLARLAKEVRESWPKFLDAAFSRNMVGDAITGGGWTEKEAVERELGWMQDHIDSLLREVQNC